MAFNFIRGAVSRRRWKIEDRWQLITNRKSYTCMNYAEVEVDDLDRPCAFTSNQKIITYGCNVRLILVLLTRLLVVIEHRRWKKASHDNAFSTWSWIARLYDQWSRPVLRVTVMHVAIMLYTFHVVCDINACFIEILSMECIYWLRHVIISAKNIAFQMWLVVCLLTAILQKQSIKFYCWTRPLMTADEQW